jgi:hypothetical protein
LDRKVQLEVLKVSQIGNINDAAYLKSSKEETKQPALQSVTPSGVSTNETSQ